MVNYFIYATDVSGSTSGATYYSAKGLETLKNFNEEVSKLQNEAQEKQVHKKVYLHWSDDCIKVGENQVISRYTQQYGGGGTCPHTILEWIKQNVKGEDTIQLLYVITDGAIHRSAIRVCDRNMVIDYVTFYAFNSNLKDIDMSVASMFICKNKCYKIHCNEMLVDEIDLANPYDYDQITLETFAAKKEELKSYIKLQFLTKKSSDQMALDEITKLKHLQTRLFNEQRDSGEFKDFPKSSSVNLNITDKETFISLFKTTRYYKTLMNPNYCDKQHDIDSCINTLINYINNDKKSFGFYSLKYSQKFTELTEEEEVGNVFYENAKEIKFPDVITCNDTGVPVILLTHYNLMDKILLQKLKPDSKLKPNMRVPHLLKRQRASRSRMPHVYMTAHFSRFKNMIKCPLVLLSDKKFKTSIEYFYNLEAFKSMKDHGMNTGPRTRQEFTGAIVPLDEFNDYNDYVLACTYFERRKVPFNKGLFYYVLYKTCEKLEYIEPNVIDYLRGYIIRRIAKTKCNLGLSDVSVGDPKLRVNLTTALWYCVELSSVIFKNDEKHFTKEKMRMFSHFVEYMKEILTWFQYNIDDSSVNLRADIFKHINRLKRIPRPEDKTMFILKQIFNIKCGFLLAEIINPDNMYKLNYLQMDHKKVIEESLLSAEVDVQKFAHFMYHNETTHVPVCKQTMRPHFVTEDKTPFYEQLITKCQKVSIQNKKLVLEPVSKLNLARILSVYKLYISYVEELSKFPSCQEYRRFVLKKKQYFRGKPVIFATNTLKTLKKVYYGYKKLIDDAKDPITIPQFVKRAKTSANRENRIRQENPINFDMNVISDYIKKAESYIEYDKYLKEGTSSF